jgi:hypothetical protein
VFLNKIVSYVFLKPAVNVSGDNCHHREEQNVRTYLVPNNSWLRANGNNSKSTVKKRHNKEEKATFIHYEYILVPSDNDADSSTLLSI